MGRMRIISYSDEPFKDRREAGRLLAGELMAFRGIETVVLGVPRGGLVIAEEIALILGASLDVVLSRKLGYPGNPELAIGAITENGRVFLNKAFASQFKKDDRYLIQEEASQFSLIKQRIEQYRSAICKVPIKNKTAIIVDDGVATGSTMEAALWSARQEGPKRLIAALPVGPEDSLERLSASADEVICLRSPAYFAAIGQFYNDFSQVDDGQVMEILTQEAERKKL